MNVLSSAILASAFLASDILCTNILLWIVVNLILQLQASDLSSPR